EHVAGAARCPGNRFAADEMSDVAHEILPAAALYCWACFWCDSAGGRTRKAPGAEPVARQARGGTKSPSGAFNSSAPPPAGPFPETGQDLNKPECQIAQRAETR